jgi:hypothetical protein
MDRNLVVAEKQNQVFVPDAPMPTRRFEHVYAAGFRPFADGVRGDVAVFGNF